MPDNHPLKNLLHDVANVVEKAAEVSFVLVLAPIALPGGIFSHFEHIIPILGVPEHGFFDHHHL